MWLVPFLILLVGFSATAVGWGVARRSAAAAEKERVQSSARTAETTVRQGVRANVDAVSSIANFVTATFPPSTRAFRYFVDSVDFPHRAPAVKTVVLVENVDRAGTPALEARMRAEGDAGFQVLADPDVDLRYVATQFVDVGHTGYQVPLGIEMVTLSKHSGVDLMAAGVAAQSRQDMWSGPMFLSVRSAEKLGVPAAYYPKGIDFQVEAPVTDRTGHAPQAGPHGQIALISAFVEGGRFLNRADVATRSLDLTLSVTGLDGRSDTLVHVSPKSRRPLDPLVVRHSTFDLGSTTWVLDIRTTQLTGGDQTVATMILGFGLLLAVTLFGAVLARQITRRRARRAAAEARKREQALEVELRHAQKLEAVGRLAGGIAHEINTPIQFIGDNVMFLRGAFEDLMALVDAPGRGDAAGGEGRPAVEDAEYLAEEVPEAIAQTMEGVERVATIVRAMKAFGHPGGRDRVLADVDEMLSDTLVVARNEIKYVADVETDLGAVGPIMCFPGDLNQVWLNLLVNAAHAIGDRVADAGGRGRITVRTRTDGDVVVVEIGDTGTGIPDEIRDHVFEPFFTTKDVGEGTGQGLALARSIVVERHHGTIAFTSRAGEGTTFTVRLPIADGAATRGEPAGAVTGRGRG